MRGINRTARERDREITIIEKHKSMEYIQLRMF